MSKLDDIWNYITDKNGSAVDAAGAVFGLLGDLQTAWGAARSFAQLMGFISQQDDQLQQVLKVIQDEFNKLEKEGLAEDKLQRMRNIDSKIDPAFAIFRQIPAFLATGPHSQEFIVDQITPCLTAILSLADDDDNWQAVKGELPSYSDDWSGTLAPQSGNPADLLTTDGLVFNYIYTLPQFLRAIYFFLTVVGALEPSLLIDNDYQLDLQDCVTRLQAVHDTIKNGIVPTKMPTPVDISSGKDKYIPAWYNSHPNWSYGVVDIYTATSSIGSYVYPDWPNNYNLLGSLDVSDWSSQAFANFSSLLQLRILRKKKDLYNQLGLPAVKQVINQLRQLTGQQLLTDPPYEAWSVGEVFSTLGLLPSPTDPSGVEPTLYTFLRETPPYSSFLVWKPRTVKMKHPHRDITEWDRETRQLPLPTVPLFYFLTGTYVPHGDTSNVLSSYVWLDSSQQHVFYLSPSTTGIDVYDHWWYTTAPCQQNSGDLTAQTGAPSASATALSSYVWPDGSSQHGFYLSPGPTGGADVQELVWDATSGWRYGGDLTAQTGAPSASTDSVLSSYVWPGASSQHGFYVESTHIGETEAPSASTDRVLSSYVGPGASLPGASLFYVGTDGRVHELWWGVVPEAPLPPGTVFPQPRPSWHNGDSVDSSLKTTLWKAQTEAGAPSASATALSSYVWPDGSSQHGFYLSPGPTGGADVQELVWDATSGWRYGGDLTAQTGAPSASTDSVLSSYVWPDGSSQHVFYLSADGHVHELVWHATSGWQYAGDLMVASKHMVEPTHIGETEAPSAATNSVLSSYVWPDGSSQHVFYVGTDGRVHELWWGVVPEAPFHLPLGTVPRPSWYNGDLTDSSLMTAQTGAPSASATALSSYARPDGREQHVFYRSADGHVQELSWDATSGWRYAGDLTT